jgi:hypothetical protein
MRRRDFIARSGMAAGALALPKFSDAAEKKHSKQLLELRIYHFASPQKQQAFAQFLGNAAVPAFNRAGARPVGLFKLLMNDNPELKLASDSTDLYLLVPHTSAESFGLFHDRLASDKIFQQAVQPIISAPKADPAYLRYESTLMRPFDGFPQVKVPAQSAGRLLQLRIYESHNQERALKKIEMFNTGGELAIFVRCGMTGVFFGQSLAGPKLPNLTYMLAFPNEQDQKKAWDSFRNDAEWKQLSKQEQYKDAVSNVTNLILRPVEGSQV